ncbi:DUF6691 family protein [Albimonas pacifica]|uniref:Sulphur transport domain-containing protein n=1 Tax=Albimonas pacifica TaxID=1114924 RepID=A0A1I3GVA1_9RHOB|nr:DUF6691 family protein [Albimonas pacifica]SFI27262.1 hypothetical protein SAMN05216258_105352 [Albimonas pacifica]
MRRVLAFVVGLAFGLGLLVSDMANPARVLAFLDVLAIPAGTWDPTLMFVMAGAMSVSAAAWLLARPRRAAVFGGAMPGPARPQIDARLVGGSALFGIGWGLSGICPGGGLAALAIGGAPVAVFLAAMVAGMALFALVDRRFAQARA